MNLRTTQPRMRRRRKAKAREYRSVAMKRIERKYHKLSRAIYAFVQVVPETLQQLKDACLAANKVVRAYTQEMGKTLDAEIMAEVG
jgi:hypothetical protein